MTLGNGILIVWTDIAPELEADFNDWYNHEHLPDRIGRMPGFLRGRRFVLETATPDAPKYLTYYDLQDATVMMSDAHVALRRQRSERDHFFVPRFRNTIKGICDVVCRAGDSDGDHLVLLPLMAAPQDRDGLAATVCDDWLPALREQPDVACATYARRNDAVTAASAAKDDRAGDRYLHALIAVETRTRAAANAVLSFFSSPPVRGAAALRHEWSPPCVLCAVFALNA